MQALGRRNFGADATVVEAITVWWRLHGKATSRSMLLLGDVAGRRGRTAIVGLAVRGVAVVVVVYGVAWCGRGRGP